MTRCTTLARLILLSLALALAAVRDGHAAESAQRPLAELSAPYAFQSVDQSVTEALRRFAVDHGLKLRISGTDMWSSERLDGWIRAETGRGFLEQLASAHHFNWFVANRKLHVSASNDSTIERIALRGLQADAARAALEAVGLYDARFGWGQLTGRDAVLVAGPREYTSLVRRFLATQPASEPIEIEAQPMVFPLHYAQAGDSLVADGRSAPRAGVASVLRQLVARELEPAAPRFALPAMSSAQTYTAPPLLSAASGIANWLGPASYLPPLPELRAASGSVSSAAQAPRVVIVADERTNAVLVWADPKMRSRFQLLIDALDKPLPMVAIEVLVIEFDEATIRALASNGRPADGGASAGEQAFHAQLSQALNEQRGRVLNLQRLVGSANLHATLAIGAEEPNDASASASADDANASGRAGNRGDALDLVARILPAASPEQAAIAVDVALVMAQPTGMPGQGWARTSSLKLNTAVTLAQGAAPLLIATYPVATSRMQQRAIFISAKTL